VIKYTRPQAPDDFANKVAEARANLENAAQNRKLTKEDFPPHWSDYKDVFVQAQHGKCFFCEGKVTATHYGDVEHFRPKAAITLPGPGITGKKGKKAIPISAVGYWWLAYSWENYSLSCQLCNQQHKKNHFPTTPQIPATGPDRDNPEDSLILNAFDDEDIDAAWEISESGLLMDRNEKGKQTWIVCGLNRDPLVEARREKGVRVADLLSLLGSAEEAGELSMQDLCVKMIQREGADESEYAAVERATVNRLLNVSWQEFLLL